MNNISVIDLNQHLLSLQAAYFRAKQADLYSNSDENIPDNFNIKVTIPGQFNNKVSMVNHARSRLVSALQAYMGESGKGLVFICFNKNKIEIPVTTTVFDFDFTVIDCIMPAD